MSADEDGRDGKRTAEQRDGATATVLGEAIGRHLAGHRAIEGKQIGLFDDADPLPDGDQAGELPDGPRRPGRPPGAKNKATEAFRAFVRARYGDPLLKLMERAFADPKVMASALGMDAGDVWQRQNEILLRLLPFMHSAMPAELKIQAKGALAVAISSVPGGLKPGDQMLEVDPVTALINLARNQWVNVEGQGESNDDQSNAEPVLIDGSRG